MDQKIIYMDNGDTTRIDDRVLEYMNQFYLTSYGNPVSLHSLGMDADENLNEARSIIAKSINAEPEEIIFTSGATESNNTAITGIAEFLKNKGNHIIISSIEHSSVRTVANRLKNDGYKVDEVKVDGEGFIDIDDLKSKFKSTTILVSVIYANYEIGTIQNIKEIGRICREKGVLFHTDAAQAFGKIKIDVKNENIDLMTFNAHKNHGPKGTGALFIKKGIKLKKLMEGGAHEFNIRAGTENLPAIMGFARSAEIAYDEFDKDIKRIISLRDRLIVGLLKIDHVTFNGPKGDNIIKRLPHNVDITFHYIEGEAILMHLSLRGICVSSGSACSSKTLEPSHVLTAIGLKHEQAHGSIRFTLSKFNTEEEVGSVIKNVTEVVEILRSMSSFVPEKHSELINKNAQTFYKNIKSGE
ncbi:MAG TPA: cysteine desulfurase family protein [Clostridiales bacterium]|nr:cysteine desulfurase family protein [Clostridiales bacterium]HQP70343.1 cysteine desulfurase family protein [Clostridiales bacterium]